MLRDFSSNFFQLMSLWQRYVKHLPQAVQGGSGNLMQLNQEEVTAKMSVGSRAKHLNSILGIRMAEPLHLPDFLLANRQIHNEPESCW